MGITRQNWTNDMLGQKSRAGGFTLIEMMIAVAIIGIGSAIAVPSYLSWNARYQLKQAATEIQSQLVLARLMAMNRNSAVTMNLAVNAGRVQIAAVDAGLNQVIQPTQMMSSVTGLSPGPANVTFSPLGTRSGGGTANQLIVISNNQGLSYSVQITPRGKIKWCAASTCA
ncbi:MAG: prepilin-type N-terminal cleavage/methylation domain-containing protein [Nitrospira sp.]|nr:prepilin-type N-terminal cleavage/methylation domain-containing protein [Nitrospira sp.]